MSDSDYERQQHLKNLNEECIKFKRKERNNRYYTNKKLKLIKEKENNIPTDNQNVNDDRNYNLIGKSDEKKNVSFECENKDKSNLILRTLKPYIHKYYLERKEKSTLIMEILILEWGLKTICETSCVCFFSS